MENIKVPRILVNPPGLRASEFIRKDGEAMSQSYFRPYPLVVEEAKGSFLKDVDGNIFIDFVPGLGAGILGHGHPAIIKAVKSQLEKAIQPGGMTFYFDIMINCAEKLAEVAPGGSKKRVFFANSGAEANECALKLARWHTKRQKLIAFIGGFHGRTLGTLSLTAKWSLNPAAREDFGPLIPEVIHVPYAYCYRCAYKLEYPDCGLWCVHYIEDIIFRNIHSPEEVAATIVEPIQGASGVIVPPDEFIPEIKKLCEKYGIIFIADEHFTGFGRTGKMFAVEHLKIEPDILSVAKSMAGGLACTACIAKSEIMNWTRGTHTSTFSGNGPAIAATLATLEVLQREKLLERVAKLEKRVLRRLAEMQEEYKFIGDVRGKGLFFGVELVKDLKTKEYGENYSKKVCEKAFKKGLIVLGGGISAVRFWPASTISEDLLEKGLDILQDSFNEVEKEIR